MRHRRPNISEMEDAAVELAEQYLKKAHPPMFHLPMAKLGQDLIDQLERDFPGFSQEEYQQALQGALSKLR